MLWINTSAFDRNQKQNEIPEIFRFVTLPLSLKLYSRKFHKIIIPTGISKTKNQDPCHWNSTWFFLDHSWPGNSTSFSLTPLESGISTFCLFIQYPWKLHVLTPLHHPPVWNFLEWNSQLIKIAVTWVQQHELFLVFGK